MSKVKVQFFMSKTPNAWKLVGYRSDNLGNYRNAYWKESQYAYDGNEFDVRVMNQSSLFPPIKQVLKMVSKYMELHQDKFGVSS